MADNSVFITGIAEGTLQAELEKLPPWATQDTAQDIEEILKKTLKLQTDAFSKMVKAMTKGGGLSADDAKDFNDELKKITDEYKKDTPKRKKRWKDEEDEHVKQQKRWKDWANNHPKTMAAMAGLAWASDKIKEAFIQNVQTYDKLTKAGINVVAGFDGVSNGFTALRDLTSLTNVRFTELAASLEKYATAVNSIGLAKFGQTLAATTLDMQDLGFTTKEASEALGSYLETQLGYANTQYRTQEQTNEALLTYSSRISKLSIVTGQSRQAIMANIEAISKSNEANTLAANVGYEAADATLSFIGSIKNQNLGRSILKMMTDQIKPLNETFMSFQKIGLGGFGNKLIAFTNSLKGLDPADAAQRMKAFEAQNHAEIEYGKQQANLYSQIPELAGEANKALTTFNEIQQTARSTVEISKDDLKKQQDTNKARTALANQWEKLMSSFQRAFAPTPAMLELLTKGLSVINTVVDAIITTFKKLDDILGENTTAYIGLGIIAAGMAFTLKKIPSIIGNLLGGGGGKNSGGSNSSGRGGRGGGRGNNGPGFLEKLGKGIGEIGKGLGTGLGGLVGGFLKGLAEGLTALGSPKVLLGVVALAGIGAALWVTGKAVQEFTKLDWTTMAKAGVALVGLGLAGAAAGLLAPEIALGALAFAAMGGALWVIGKAMQAVGPGLEATAIGFNAFGQINGDNLMSVAKGIVALGGALTVFAAASAVSGVGGIIANVSNGLAGLTGGSVLSKLKDFASLGDSLQKGVAAIVSVNASLSTLSDTLSSFSGLNTLKSIVSTINDLNITKALAFAAIGRFSNVSLPAPTAPSTVTKAPAPSSLDSPSKTVLAPDGKATPPEKASEPIRQAGPGLEKATGGGDINSILRYQTSLLEQLVQGNNNIISVNKDILKYTRVKV